MQIQKESQSLDRPFVSQLIINIYQVREAAKVSKP